MNELQLQAKNINEKFFNKACEDSNGLSWKACCYIDEFMQNIYYHSIFKNINTNFNTILDVGCGQGDLLNFIKRNFKKEINYEGIDVSGKMIDECKKRFPKNTFINNSFLELNNKKYDVILSVGCFNVKISSEIQDQKKYLKENIKKMYNMCNYCCSFTLLSNYGYEENEGTKELFFYEPGEILQDCLGITSSVMVDHCSIPIEFIVTLYK